MAFPGLPDVPGIDLPDVVGDAIDGGVDALGDLGDSVVRHTAARFGLDIKSMAGAWDLVEDGAEIVYGAVRECIEWLWEQVPEFVRNPFGDPRPLEEAAAGWRSILADVERARDDISSSGRTLADWKGPDSDRFDTFFSGLLTDTSRLSSGIEGIADALSSAAEALADLRRLVHSILAEIAAYLAFDAILVVLTAGVGAAGAAVHVSLLVGKVTNAIRRAVEIVRGVLPMLNGARALNLITRATFKVDDYFTNNPIDLARKVGSTVVGNGVSTAVASGQHPGDWGAKEWVSAVGGTAASLGVAYKLKPFWDRRRGSDSVLASTVNGGLSSGATSLASETTSAALGDGFSLTKVGVSAVTGGGVAGTTRSGSFLVNGGKLRGAPGARLSERAKGLGRIPEGLGKGVSRQPILPDGPTTPEGPDSRTPRFDDVPSRPFGTATYTVRHGDDLTTIAKAKLGDGDRYPELIGGASPAIKDPDHIHPGQAISLPR